METWNQAHPSYKGKEILLKTLVQSKAIFLASVNGMPNDISKKMQRQMKDFLWDYKKKGVMRWNEVINNREQGGLNIPDIEARVEAIQVMWLKRWLAPENKKPLWAYMTDEIIKKSVPEKPKIKDENRIQWISQSWNESMARTAKISKAIRYMLKTARKFNLEK